MHIDFKDIPYWVNKNFYPLWFDRNRFIVKKGGAGCIHGDSLLSTPKGKVKIKDFKGGNVHSWNGEKVVSTYATPPKKYKKAPLYEVTTKEGKKITCTAKHRFLTNYGWLQTSDLIRPGLVIYGESLDLPKSSSDTSRITQHEDVPHSMKTVQDYQLNYSTCCRLYGEQLQSVKDTVLNDLPLLADVDEHTRLSLRKDGRKFLQVCSRFYRKLLHLSKNGLNVLLHNQGVNLLSYIVCKPFVLLLQTFLRLNQFLLRSSLQQQGFGFDQLTLLNTCNILHVESITQKGVQVYYDITVPNFHNYIAEGMINHNSGKSVDTMRLVVYRLVAERGHNYLVCRRSGKSNRMSTWPLLKSCIADWNLESLFKANISDQTITCILNGNQIKFTGLDDIEKIKSITFDNGPLTDIIIEEATEVTETHFNQLNLRLRGIAKQPFQMTLQFNPVSDTHWIKNRFFDNPGPKKGKITIHESTYMDNRFLDKDYKDELEALKYEDKVYYDVYALGKWGSIGNLVFRNVRYETINYTEEDFDEVLCGMDFGFNHYHANEKIGIKDGVKYSFDELYVRQMTNDEIMIENENKGMLKKWEPCTADSAEPKSILDWNRNGYTINGAIKGPDSVRQQIGYLNRGDWVIDPEKCPGLASEVKGFKWKEDKDGNVLDEPVKFKDDAIAACRYAIEEKTTNGLSILDAL